MTSWACLVDSLICRSSQPLRAQDLFELLLQWAGPNLEPELGRSIPRLQEVADHFAGAHVGQMKHSLFDEIEVIGQAGEVLHERLRTGDLVLTRSRESDRFTTLSVVVSARPILLDDLAPLGYHAIGATLGLYVPVIEAGPIPKPLLGRWARRLADVSGQIPRDTLVLRLPTAVGISVPSGSTAFRGHQRFEQVTYRPSGGPVPRLAHGPLNCAPHPPTSPAATLLPQYTPTPDDAGRTALVSSGLTRAQIRQLDLDGLRPIAETFGSHALTDLLARLRWRPDFLVEHRVELIPRLLIHIPGHFRELARRAPGAREAHALESLGWLLMRHLRNRVESITSDRWWVPPAPSFVGPFADPLPAISQEVIRLILRIGFVDTLLPYQQYDRRFTEWRDGLAGRQWGEEILGSNPGRLFYRHLVSIPAHRRTATERRQFSRAFAARVADADRDWLTAAPDEISLNGLRKTEALRRCDNGNRHLPRGAWREADLGGIELVPATFYPLRLSPDRRPRVYGRLPVLAAIQPVVESLFEALRELGWNDLVFQSAGSGCFRGTKLRPRRFFRNPTPSRLAELQAESPRNLRRVQRAMRAARRMSNHALGVAIDVNTFENDRTGGRPFGSLDPRVVALFEAFHFRWGACFPQPDPMHFEYCQAPCAPPLARQDAPQSSNDDTAMDNGQWDADDDVYDSMDDEVAPDWDRWSDDTETRDADDVDPQQGIVGDDGQVPPPLPEEVYLVGPTGDASEEVSVSLTEGCYLIEYVPDSTRGSQQFEGTLRVERTGSGVIASGDLYSTLGGNASVAHRDFSMDRRPPADIPIFPRDKYAAYLRVVKISEVGPAAARSVRIAVQIWPYDHSQHRWNKESTRTIELTRTGPSYSIPSRGALFRGTVKNGSGARTGRATMRWVASNLREATVEIDRVPATDPLEGDQAGHNWQSVFAKVGWEVSAANNDVNVKEPSGMSWSTAELHAAMLSRRTSGADLDREWRYHLLGVQKIDITPRGVMFDAGASDSNNVPREGAAIASHWMVPTGPDPNACGKSWGETAGQRFGACPAPYFRAAVHEISHAMGLGHPSSGAGSHFLVGTNGIVCNATSTIPFPGNIEWRHSPEDTERLRHLPDHWVRPGGHPVRFREGAATYSEVPISPDDSVVDPGSLTLSVTPVIDSVPIGAPVRIEVVLANTGTTSVVVPAHFSLRNGTLSGHVVGPSGTCRSYRSLVQCLDEPRMVSHLAPGEMLTHSETLIRGADGALFSEDGWHRIEVDATWTVGDVTFRESGETSVLVTPPEGEAHEAAAQQVLSAPDTLLVLALGGDHLTEGISAIRAALENPVLRPHYAFIEAKRLARRFFNRAPDVERGLALLDEATVLSDAEVRRTGELAASHLSPIDVDTKGDSAFTSLAPSTETTWGAEEWAETEEALLEAFRPFDLDEGALSEGFWDAQVGSGGRPRDFKLEFELNYGMERAVGGAPRGFPFIPLGSRLPDGTKVTTHTKSSDGFEVVMDGPRMEIETRRFGLEQPAELDRIMTNILGFVRDLRRACQNKSPRTVPASARAGKVRDFHLPIFANPDFLAFPIKDSRKQMTWFRQSCRVGTSPQCTIDVPLESVIAFVTELRRSQQRERSKRWTGRSGSRAGLRSDALYHALDAVLKSFRAHSAAGRATNRQLTRKLAGFIILLVQYLRTSEIRYHKPDRPGDATFTKPDPGSRDHEQFPKAYVPLVAHTHFHVMFHKILSSSERTLFLSLYGDSSVRQNLFNLALDAPGSKSGSAELFPARTRGIQARDFGSVLTWNQLVDSAIDLTKLIRDTAGNVSLPTPLATASKGVAKTGPAGARVKGVRLEMRRMGYRWWRPSEWKTMSRELYKIARKLNGIP